MDSQRVRIISVKDRLNNICQLNHFKAPIHTFGWHFKQRIPICVIGTVTFSARNWTCDDNEKVIILTEMIIDKLNKIEFVTENSEALSSNYYGFDSVFDLNDTKEMIVSITPKLK